MSKDSWYLHLNWDLNWTWDCFTWKNSRINIIRPSKKAQNRHHRNDVRSETKNSNRSNITKRWKELREPIDNDNTLSVEENGEIKVLENIDHSKIPQVAQQCLEKLKKRMHESQIKAAKYRNIAMDKQKLYYDRTIKKYMPGIYTTW